MEILKRLAIVPVLFVIVSFGVFVLIDLAPGDVAVELAGQNATDADVERVRTDLGLDQPLLTRYGSWLGDAAQGDLGQSLTRNQGVGDLIGSKLEPTMSLAVLSLAIAGIFGGLLGLLAGVYRGRFPDRAVSIFASAGIAMPQFWVGLLLVSFFALDLAWLPATGYTPMSESITEWARHLILPTIALSWVSLAEVARHVRSASAEVLEKPHILTARAKGLGTATVVRRHVIRNAGIPVVTVLGTRIAQLLGGTVVIETVFGIQGLGTLTVQSVLSRDMPVILGVVALATAVVLVINLVVDLSYGLIDPRANA
ncbi:MAG TPA: ABC transporter permease [Nocardioides sp.]